MGAMYRLKAYFGLVPAEDMAEYADEPPVERYAGRRIHDPADRWGAGEYGDEPVERLGRSTALAEERSAPRYDDDRDRRPVREPVRAGASVRPREVVSRLDRGAGGAGGLGPSAVRGALAMDTDALRDREPALREPVRLPERTPPPVVPEQRVGGAAALARITTLQPRSYNEARTIGERYRDGVPVIMNLTELDDAAAKRLVDFAAGLAFALRGSIDKVTSRVFLLTPADVEVSADDARRLADRALYRQE